MSRAAAPSRQLSSSRGGWPTRNAGPRRHCGEARPIQLGSTWRQLTRLLKTAFTCSSGLTPLRLWGHPRSAWQRRTRGVGEGRLRRGMAGVQAWPPGLDHRRSFLTRTLDMGMYFHLSLPVPQMRSGLPRYVPTGAHDWCQALTDDAQKLLVFGAFTSKHVGTIL